MWQLFLQLFMIFFICIFINLFPDNIVFLNFKFFEFLIIRNYFHHEVSISFYQLRWVKVIKVFEFFIANFTQEHIHFFKMFHYTLLMQVVLCVIVFAKECIIGILNWINRFQIFLFDIIQIASFLLTLYVFFLKNLRGEINFYRSIFRFSLFEFILGCQSIISLTLAVT